MSIVEILLVSVGLSIDVFVASAYIGAGFSKIKWKNLVLLSILFGGIQLGVLVLGNLVTLLPLLSITRTQTAADRWEGPYICGTRNLYDHKRNQKEKSPGTQKR